MGRLNKMPDEERFSRTVIGIVLVISSFFVWGKWVAFVLGFLFLLSAWQGFCLTCEIYKKFVSKSR